MKRAIVWLFALSVLAGIAWAGWQLAGERKFAATPFGEGSRRICTARPCDRSKWCAVASASASEVRPGA